MRQVILLIILFSTLISYGQKVKAKNIPPQARVSFNSLYPDVKEVYWTKQGKIYVAEFVYKDVNTSLVFDKDGKLNQTIIFIKKEELPKQAQDFINNNFGKKKLGDITKIKDSKGDITFNVEIKNNTVIFDEYGKYIRSLK